MNEGAPSGERLDSWKAIAEYLQRDVTTVARWEKSLGLPVRRVAGSGRSVFAYTSEIDAWIQTTKPILAVDTALPPAATISLHRARWRWLGIGGAALAVAIGAFFIVRSALETGSDLRIEISDTGLVARNTAGVEKWRHPFPVTDKTTLIPRPVQIVVGAHPGVYFGTAYHGRQSEDQMESGALTLLDTRGRLQHTFSFTDQVALHERSYSPPWMLMAFAISDAGGTRRVAVAGHHYVWDPGIVTILDEQWQRHGTFVHAGWIEDVHWISSNRLLVAGFSNAQDGGMIALLDADALDGQGPEPAGGAHFCESCGPGRPLRMFVFPRTEVNRASASPFNRALLQTFPDGRVFVHTIEMPSETGGDAEVLYEFNASLDLVKATFSDRYREMHRALEADGKFARSSESTADRSGPDQVRMWEPILGWQSVQIPRAK